MLSRTVTGVFLSVYVMAWSSQMLDAGEQGAPVFEAWQVLDVRGGRAVAFDEWAGMLAQQDVIYLGEEHRNQWHIEAALKILRALMEHGRRPVLAMEMFGWDGQAAVDRYIGDSGMSREEFLSASHWEQNWGGAFQDYEPLVTYARRHRLSLLALNPPRPLVRRVATQGLKTAMHDAEMRSWRMDDEPMIDDVAYRDVILKQLQLCHGGLPAEAYERMYEASMFRDEGMAKTISESLQTTARSDNHEGRASRAPIGPIVSYTGGGHIQYQLPIPKRVLRKAPGELSQVTIYMTSFTPEHPEEVQELLHDAIADYIWLTPIGVNGPAKRCR